MRRLLQRWRCGLGIVALTPVVASALGCITIAGALLAHSAKQSATRKYEQRFPAEVGVKTKDDYVKEWGPPYSSTPVSDGEVCVWHRSYGTRASAHGSQYHASASSHEVYDELILTFNDEGRLAEYRFDVRR